jgi:ParB/RepB/Spo0J family partition protein
MKLKIDDIRIDPTIQVRESLDRDLIAVYQETFEQLPPILVMKMNGKLTLADGWHRLSAARELGHTSIEASVVQGDRARAIAAAVVSNCRHGNPLTMRERREGIRRLSKLKWKQQEIARQMGVAQQTVSGVINASALERRFTISGKIDPKRRHSVLEAISTVKKPAQQEKLIEAAAKREWTSEQAQQAARNIGSEYVPDEHKADLLKGKSDPLVYTDEGEARVPAATLDRSIAHAKKNSARLAFLDILKLTNRFTPQQVVEQTKPRDLDRLDEECERLQAYFGRVSDEVKSLRKLRVVS